MDSSGRQPGPVADLWDWQYDGLCRATDPEEFFHPEGERGAARRRREDRAKQVCARCPVLEQCREHALATKEAYGVWGGLSEEERERAWAERERRLRLRSG